MKFSSAQPECYLDNLTETYLAFSHPDIDSGTQGNFGMSSPQLISSWPYQLSALLEQFLNQHVL